MEYVEILLLIMTALVMSQVTARPQRPDERFVPAAGSQHPGRGVGQGQGLVVESQHPGRGRGHGKGHGQGQGQGQGRDFQGNANMGGTIPGFPMKGPPSAPFVYPQQPMAGGGASINTGNSARNYQTNNLPVYLTNPFLPQATNTQGQAQSNKRFEEIQNLPSIEPVTNDLPSGTSPKSTVNPREFDLLYGSNLYEEKSRTTSQNLQTEPNFNIDDRILIDSAPHCNPPYMLVGTVCRLKV